jgi:hypothetical protein
VVLGKIFLLGVYLASLNAPDFENALASLKGG